MKSILDDKTIDLSCPKCGHKLRERLGKLKTNPTLTCAGCGSAIRINADHFRRETAKIDKAMADIKRTLGRMGK